MLKKFSAKHIIVEIISVKKFYCQKILVIKMRFPAFYKKMRHTEYANGTGLSVPVNGTVSKSL